jgi:hypothetical protein
MFLTSINYGFVVGLLPFISVLMDVKKASIMVVDHLLGLMVATLKPNMVDNY